jgi:hypothetical protein
MGMNYEIVDAILDTLTKYKDVNMYDDIDRRIVAGVIAKELEAKYHFLPHDPILRLFQ